MNRIEKMSFGLQVRLMAETSSYRLAEAELHHVSGDRVDIDGSIVNKPAVVVCFQQKLHHQSNKPQNFSQLLSRYFILKLGIPVDGEVIHANAVTFKMNRKLEENSLDPKDSENW